MNTIKSNVLKRRFQNPVDYPDYSKAANKAVQLTQDMLHASPQQREASPSETVACAVAGCWVASNGPVYWLGEGLEHALINTECPDGMDVPLAFRSAIIMLKHGIATPEGPIRYLMAQYVSVEDDDSILAKQLGLDAWIQEMQEANTVGCILVAGWPANDPNTFYLSKALLQSDGRFASTTYGAEAITGKMLSLVVQSLLLMGAKPELIEEAMPSRTLHGVGFNQDYKALLNPIWIGRHYKQRSSGPGTGPHTSPQAHWRRGHWRRVAYGVGRTKREWRWFEPTFVNGIIADS